MSNKQLKQDHFRVKATAKEEEDHYKSGRGAQIYRMN